MTVLHWRPAAVKRDPPAAQQRKMEVDRGVPTKAVVVVAQLEAKAMRRE
jgi:hypothetical protein